MSAILDRSIIALISLGHYMIVILCFFVLLSVIVPLIWSILCLVKCLTNDRIMEDLPDDLEPWTTTTYGGTESTSSSGGSN